MLNNMTALISCFARSYHTETSNIKIYDDKFAREMLSDKEYKNIFYSMTGGIEFFNADYRGNDPLGWIVNNHLAPAVLARSSFNERHLNNEIKLGLCQYVLLGAGYDTSSYKVNDKVDVFELDRMEMIIDKKTRVEKANIDTRRVSYIGCDFSKDWINLLLESGFDRSKKTLFSILGVSYYLEKETFFKMIKLLADNMEKGSSIIFDYPVRDDFYNMEKEELARGAGEAMKGKYSREDILALCDSCSLHVYEDLDSDDIDRDYFYGYNTINPNNRIYAPKGVNYCLLVK